MAAESSSINLEQVLKPFYQRASEAEDRLARLEAATAVTGNKDDSGELLNLNDEIQSKIEIEREKAAKEMKYLRDENAKLNNRILHLIRAVKEADSKLHQALKDCKST